MVKIDDILNKVDEYQRDVQEGIVQSNNATNGKIDRNKDEIGISQNSDAARMNEIKREIFYSTHAAKQTGSLKRASVDMDQDDLVNSSLNLPPLQNELNINALKNNSSSMPEESSGGGSDEVNGDASTDASGDRESSADARSDKIYLYARRRPKKGTKEVKQTEQTLGTGVFSSGSGSRTNSLSGSKASSTTNLFDIDSESKSGSASGSDSTKSKKASVLLKGAADVESASPIKGRCDTVQETIREILDSILKAEVQNQEKNRFLSDNQAPQTRYYYDNKDLVQIALRRKGLMKKGLNSSYPRLHLKYLSAELRVALTCVPSIYTLFETLVPQIGSLELYSFYRKNTTLDKLFNKSPKEFSEERFGENGTYSKITWQRTKGVQEKFESKPVQIVDSGLVNKKKLPKKILQSFSGDREGKRSSLPIFNHFSSAIRSQFGLSSYTLLRITRSSVSDSEGSVLLKLETARVGDFSLIDDPDYIDEIFQIVNSKDKSPKNLFIKKVVARPRYKSGMKLYFLPFDFNCTLYVDERLFRRDLFNGIISLDAVSPPKDIYCTFNFEPVLKEFKEKHL